MDIQLLERKKDLENELKRIVEIIIKNYAPEKIILFGSLASGEISEFSDIDLLVVQETKERFIERLHKVRCLTHPKEGVDFIVYTPGEVENMKHENRRFFTKEILEKGKIVYERK
jgi:predicted nucleotidyltransferase